MAAAVALRRAALMGPSFGLGGWIAVDERPRDVAFKIAVLPVRLARDVKCAVLSVGDYTWSLHGLEGEVREEAKRQCHARGAQRLLDLCFANQGIYIKLGQHIAVLDHLLPEEYVHTMRAHMLDRCPVSSWEQVQAVVREDLGAPVHVAHDRDGRKLAVKVQHKGLLENSQVDLLTIDWLVWGIKQVAPNFDYTWLVDEAKENLPLELDFLHEAANAERCRAKLAGRACAVRGRVVVPEIDHARTSARVLTMEFIEGVKVTDGAGLARLGAAPADVARLISKTFNEMIFTWGDVHVDPHTANLLIRGTPAGARTPAWRAALPAWLGGGDCAGGGARGAFGGAAPPGTRQPWQLVLLDHGLYRQLDDTLRIEYAALWRSLIFADEEGIRRHSTALNAGSAYQLFAGMLTQRPWEVITKRRGDADACLALKHTAEERREIQEYASQYAQQIGDLLLRIPRPLLLLLKTNDCLRAVDLALGAGVSNVELRMTALRGLTWLAELEDWLRGGSAGAQLAAG
eukprot:scaffold2.g7308.t1